MAFEGSKKGLSNLSFGCPMLGPDARPLPLFVEFAFRFLFFGVIRHRRHEDELLS